MSLRPYAGRRMVVLNHRASALQAARALESNEIGAVPILVDGELAGIVTDRDLATRVVGAGLDPASTTVDRIMTQEISWLPTSASTEEALELMRMRNVRRIPLLDGDRIVGMVTLDDLLLDEAAPLEELASVVHAQIGEGGPSAEGLRTPAAMRSRARAEASYVLLIQRVQEEAGLESSLLAEGVLELVLDAVVRRLTHDEAKDLIAQLPSLLQPGLQTLPPGPDREVTLDWIVSRLVERFDVDPDRAMELLSAVGSALDQSVTQGQMDDVRQQLPKDLRECFVSNPSEWTGP